MKTLISQIILVYPHISNITRERRVSSKIFCSEDYVFKIWFNNIITLTCLLQHGNNKENTEAL